MMPTAGRSDDVINVSATNGTEEIERHLARQTLAKTPRG